MDTGEQPLHTHVSAAHATIPFSERFGHRSDILNNRTCQKKGSSVERAVGIRRAEMARDVAVDLPQFLLFGDPPGPQLVQLHLALTFVVALRLSALA